MTRIDLRRAALVAGAVALLVASGCTSRVSSTNKAGARPTTSTTITLALPDIADANGRFFAEDVEKRSEGRLRVRIEDAYDSRVVSQEAKLAAAVTTGSVDAVYMPARDWAVAGLPDFQALAAPFSVTTQTAMQAVATSGFARSALASLGTQGVVGLALIPVEPRQLLSTRPLVSADDFAGASIRVVLDPALATSVSALGAHAVDVEKSSDVATLLSDGKLTAAETSPEYALSNGYLRTAPFLTAFGLYAKFQVIGVGEKVWSALDAGARKALQAAAADTLARTRDLSEQEGKELAQLCAAPAVVTTTSAQELAVLAGRAAVDTSGYAAAARELAAVPGTGPQTSAVDLPSGCTTASDSRSAQAALDRLRRGPSSSPSAPAAPFPQGTFVTTDSVQDWRAGGQYGPDWNTKITWTWTFADGRFHETQDPDFPDQGPCEGTYTTDGDQLTVHYTKGVGCVSLDDEVTRWSYFDGQLTFTVVDVADTGSRVIYSAHPWRRVG